MKFIAIKRIHHTYKYLHIFNADTLIELDFSCDPRFPWIDIFVNEHPFKGISPDFCLSDFRNFLNGRKLIFEIEIYEDLELANKYKEKGLSNFEVE